MRDAVLTLHFHNEETLRNLERVAEALGVSADDLAEAAIERELTAIGAGLEGRLARALERLTTYSPADFDRDIGEFARSEVEVDDPLRSHLAETADPYGIGELFGGPVEQG